MIGDYRLDQSLLFVDDRDRMRFLDRLSERVGDFSIRLYLFVLMANHFHLVFETPEANCSKFMHALSTAYTVYYNLRHGRHGHVLDGRFKGKLVEGDDYLLSLSRYVHLNPVKIAQERSKPIGERIKLLRSYKWSSYPSYIGRRKRFDYVEYAPLLAEMGGPRNEWPKSYRRFVESGLAETDEDFICAMRESPRSIGSDGFRAWVDELHEKAARERVVPEDVSFRHITEPLSPDVILQTAAQLLSVDVGAFNIRRRNSPLRAVAASMLIRFGGLTQREVAACLGMGTGGAVSAQVRRLPELIRSNRRLKRDVAAIGAALEELRAARQRTRADR